MQVYNNKIILSQNSRDNLLEYDGVFYQIENFRDDGRTVQGGNGVIFKLKDEQNDLEYVLKIIKFPEQDRVYKKIDKRIRRFEREIEAMSTATTNNLQNIVGFYFNGIINISGNDYQYYTMQKCDCNLKEYLLANEIDFSQKILLCKKILQGIIDLHQYKIYHRDIKHDNILFIDNEPLIGDLGLVDNRESDILISEIGEIIGPTGWFSPEAVNKFLVENTLNNNSFDCSIDEKSEIFQLGKLFWYIFQGNLPIGQIDIDDFIPKFSMSEEVFDILYNMLQYAKNKRLESTTVLAKIDEILVST